MIRDGVDARILIVSPLFDVALFLCFGVVWAGVALALRSRNVLPWAVGFYALAGCYALLASTGRLNDLACTLLALGLATQVALQIRRNAEGVLRIMRRTAPILIVLFLIGAGYAFASRRPFIDGSTKRPSPPEKAPSILLVVLDAVRADHLGAYGYSRATSPNFDRFAREGVLFENAYSSSSWTLPSHASLFTNLYNFENGVDPWFLDRRFLTLAEFLRKNFYATGGAVGNTYWCNYPTGIAQGFDSNADYFHNIPDAISRTLFGRKAMEAVLHLAGYYRNPAKKTADKVNDEILRWLDSLPEPRRQFFAFLNYYDPHEPCFPPTPYDGRFALAESINARKPLDTHRALPQPLPRERMQADLDAYDATIAYVDAQLGALWADLERRGLAQNTLLIITSDHGHSWGEGGVYGHRTSLRREQIHVPLVFYWPGHIPAGARVPTPVSQIQVPATVAELAEFPSEFVGSSLAKLWGDPAAAANWNEPVLAELSRPRRDVPAEWPIARGDMKTLVSDRWQYLEWADGTAQLFDFVTDPREERDLSQTEEGRPVATAMREKLKRLLARAPTRPPSRGVEAGPE
jgi:arylsulfatase A-like enzyme